MILLYLSFGRIKGVFEPYRRVSNPPVAEKRMCNMSRNYFLVGLSAAVMPPWIFTGSVGGGLKEREV